jgi:hypothetical protein
MFTDQIVLTKYDSIGRGVNAWYDKELNGGDSDILETQGPLGTAAEIISSSH